MMIVLASPGEWAIRVRAIEVLQYVISYWQVHIQKGSFSIEKNCYIESHICGISYEINEFW